MTTNSTEKDALPFGRVTELTEVYPEISRAPTGCSWLIVVVLIFGGYRECAEVPDTISPHFRR
jgi:hypothetical protein